MAVGLFCPIDSVDAQQSPPSRLETAKSLTCVFSLVATGAWSTSQPHADVKAAKLTLRFDSINRDDGTAGVGDGFGHYDITVRPSARTLLFLQSFRAGPLYITTVFDRESRGGKLKAVHTRHELTEVALPGFTSSPEQYYGECEAEP